MTDKIVDELEADLEMVRSEPWKRLILEVEQRLEMEDRISGVNDLPELYKRQGRIEILKSIQLREDITREYLEELENDS